MNQKWLIDLVARRILNMEFHTPLLVGIDGIDASGKTIFGNSLASRLHESGRQIIRASIDGFHFSRSVRYQRGKNSPEGYYFDSFDYTTFRSALLDPLLNNGSRTVRTHMFDYLLDAPDETPLQKVEENSILVMDGIFLFRPQLVKYWNIKIFLDISFDVSMERGAKRDTGYIPSFEEAIERYQKRYLPAQKIYLHEAQPKKIADIVIDNNDVDDPKLLNPQVL